MNRIPLLFAIGMAAAATAMEPVPVVPGEDLKPALPATPAEKIDSNPAKAAIDARRAAEKDKAAASDETAADSARAEREVVVRAIEEALHNDKRTSLLGIQIRAGDNGQIELHGTVPSAQSRSVAESIASKAATTQPVRSYLAVPDKQ